MLDKYILDSKGRPVREPDLMKWGQWFENSRETRRVARTKVGSLIISTVFLSLDHRWGKGPPILWETMVFDTKGKHPWRDLDTDRCSGSREQAEAMHQRMVNKVKGQKHGQQRKR